VLPYAPVLPPKAFLHPKLEVSVGCTVKAARDMIYFWQVANLFWEVVVAVFEAYVSDESLFFHDCPNSCVANDVLHLVVVVRAGDVSEDWDDVVY